MKIKLLFLFIFLITTLNSQTIDATLIELNFHEGSNPQDLVPFQNGFYFTATDGDYKNYGRELWYSDGTANGTSMIKDIYPGQNSSNPSSLVLVNGTLYFIANDGVHGSELWKSDGTDEGTMLVKDIYADDNNTYYYATDLINFNGTLYFSAFNGINGYELWKSDGTEAGTTMVKDINPNGDARPGDLFVFNNNIYFIANDGTNGIELWKSDGTESGTLMVKNINLNSSGLDGGNQFIILNNNFYFFANNGTNGYELWKSDGTEAGTKIVKDINAGFSSSSRTLQGSLLNNLIIFKAYNGTTGSELWKTDGTEAGTTIIKNINNTLYSSLSDYSFNEFITYNNEVYFLADDDIHGMEIWKSDGTETGTTLLKDINAGSYSPSIGKFHLDNLNNKLLFFAKGTNSSDKTLWTSDGTTNGTLELSKIINNSYGNLKENFITINNSIIISAENDKYGNELWITDGTTSGTKIFTDLIHSKHGSPQKYTNVSGNLFFTARGTEYGRQLFKSDGTIDGTVMVKDINPGYESIHENSDMRELNGILYFNGGEADHGYELWRSDGTDAGTYMVKDIRIGERSGLESGIYSQYFTVLNNKLYFAADDGIHGIEPWESDGTESGTKMIKDINTEVNGSESSRPRQFVSLNNFIYFIGNDYTAYTIWKTDGTDSGTSQLIQLNDVRILKVVNNKLIIIANTSGSSYGPHDLWVSDGTTAGTKLLMSFGDGYDSEIQFTTILNNELYFEAYNKSNGYKSVYKTDGVNVTLVFNPLNYPAVASTSFKINSLKTCGNNVYFVLNDFSFNKELWRTNGTVSQKIAGADTQDFLTINELTCYKNSLFYLAESNPHKIWMTNDNLNNAIQLNTNILNGPNFKDYDFILTMGATDNNLYFNALNDISGYELYSTNLDPATLSVQDEVISEIDNIKVIRLYPNPSKNYVKIESLTNSNIKKYEIFDLTGKSIYIKTNLDSQFVIYNTNALNKGIYFVKVVLTDNKIKTLKLIVN